ncbi:MAG: hypothetical protein K2N70_01230, partial [Helicobacter sp.]|nr:hypothetical protein [Helicobacter sp.]
ESYDVKPSVVRQTRERLCTLGDARECLNVDKELMGEKRGKSKSQAESFYRKAMDLCEDECDHIKQEWQDFKNPQPKKDEEKSEKPEQKPQIHESRI